MTDDTTPDPDLLVSNLPDLTGIPLRDTPPGQREDDNDAVLLLPAFNSSI